MKKPTIAVIYFPGLNCEHETKYSCEKAGMDAKIVLWNTLQDLTCFDGFVIPGGWSYEDRIRAGVVASRDKLMNSIAQEAKKGKPVLGICNGCQILVESGILPGMKGEVEFALAPNINPMVSGYYCSWVKVKVSKKIKTAFNLAFNDNEIIDIPIAHGEGRFVTAKEDLAEKLDANGQIALKYVDDSKNIAKEFPHNPNGSTLAIAALTNECGNVMAMMPHPERAYFKFQLPKKSMSDEKDARSLAAASKIFESMRLYIENGKN